MWSLRNIDWSLYAIIDREFLKGRSAEEMAREIILGGCGIIQYRDKVSDGGLFYRDALKLRQLTEEYDVAFIVNDRVDVALAVQADGVHLGQTDLPIKVVRELVGPDFIIGGSVHTAEEYERSRRADYFGVGCIYQTKTKEQPFVSGVGIVKKIRKLTDKPIVGIGGITLENLAAVMQAGANGVAVISGIMNASNTKEMTKRYVSALKKNHKRR